MTGWIEFTAALCAFILSHAIPARPLLRRRLVGVLGQAGYVWFFSLFSIAILAWVISAAARAPYVEIIPPADALRWAPVLVMPLVCLLGVAGIAVSNPFSFGGMGRVPFDPDHPGVLAFCRHPLLLALFLWSISHLLANGSLAHVVVFGLFAGFSVLGMTLIDRRKRTALGPDWDRMSGGTALFSARDFTELLRLWYLLPAGLVYVLFLHLHVMVIGVSPLP